ncbi:hypothetical protein LX32DRAFT_641563 [Colletotrichum zoysiae]|uniref:DUF6604 domain-containing protein n=1 Tax=Colletotrichum zoysiae TaxID=1216348 RepID=A0AAD9HD90_9PEZI|nr:hypothetical protein LX32DRAFT_641563 [Colletotrichum zoysiae]
MDPSGFQSIGIWKRYKLGQARFTEWLQQTASKFKSSPSPPATIDASKAKSKANLDSPSETLHWSELEGLAKLIVTNSKPEEIPWDPILVLRDVIALRKKSARLYAEYAKDDTTGKLEARNRQHEHIIKVLEKVLGLLEKAVAPTRSDEKGKEPPKGRPRFSMDVLDNMFSLLELHKPENSPEKPEAESDASGPEYESDVESKLKAGRNKRRPAKKKEKGGRKGKKAHKPKTVQEETKPDSDAGWVERFQFTDTIDEGDGDLDCYMLIYCFFEDFNAIRTYVCERWCDYFYDKSVSLNTLAVITNAAAELFRDMDTELCDLLCKNGFHELHSYDSMMQLLCVQYTKEQFEVPGAGWRAHDWLGLSTYVAIRNFLDQPACIMSAISLLPVAPSPQYGLTDPAEFGAFAMDCMLELLADVSETLTLKDDELEPPVIPGQPEFELLFEQMLETRRFSSCFVFCMQLYADIRNILDHQVKDARQQLQVTARTAIENMKKAMQSCDEVWNSEWRKKAERQIKHIKDYALTDFTYDGKWFRAAEMGLEDDLPAYQLFDAEPVWPGLFDFRTKLEMIWLGIDLVSRTPAPLWTGVLYHISKRDYPHIPAWPEMDRFLGVHGTGLLGFPVNEDLKAADVLVKYSTMSEAECFQVWNELFHLSMNRVAGFMLRYGGDPPESRLKRPGAEYILYIIRDRVGLPHEPRQDPFGISWNRAPPKSELSCDNPKTEEMVRQLRMIGNMRHVEVLEILDQTVEDMTKKEFALNYFKLDWEVQSFVEGLKKSMLDAGLLTSLEDGVEKFIEKPDASRLLGLAIEKAIVAAADQPFVSRMSNPPDESDDDDWSDDREGAVRVWLPLASIQTGHISRQEKGIRIVV